MSANVTQCENLGAVCKHTQSSIYSGDLLCLYESTALDEDDDNTPVTDEMLNLI